MTIIFIIVILVVFIIYSIFKNSLSNENHGYHNRQQQLADELFPEEHEQLMANLQRGILEAEVLIQADIVGDKKSHDAIVNHTYDGPLPERRDDGGFLSLYDKLRIIKIAGINHRRNINAYCGRVECALVPEPENEYDPGAIKIVAEDRHHLGYIPSDMTDFVRSMACEIFPYRCVAFINEIEDEIDGHKFYVGHVYIKKRE